MKNSKLNEEIDRRKAIKELNRLSDRIRDKQRLIHRTEHLLEKHKDEIVQIKYKFDEVLSVIQDTVLENSTNVVD